MDEMLDLASKIAKPFEGLSLTPYHDPVGYPTIGYGRLLSRTKWEPLSKWQPITEEQAEEYLEADMKKAALQAYKLCPHKQQSIGPRLRIFVITADQVTLKYPHYADGITVAI